MSQHTLAIPNYNASNFLALLTIPTSQDYAKVFLIDQNFSLTAEQLIEASSSVLYIDNSYLSEAYQTMIASEKVLAKDWNEPDEDEIWASL